MPDTGTPVDPLLSEEGIVPVAPLQVVSLSTTQDKKNIIQDLASVCSSTVDIYSPDLITKVLTLDCLLNKFWELEQ